MNIEAQIDNSDNGYYFFILYKTLGVNQYVPVFKSEIKQMQGNLFKWDRIKMLTSTC